MSALPLRRPSATAGEHPSTPPGGLAAPALLAQLSARFAATAADHDHSGAFPRENFDALQAHGLIGLVAPPPP